MRLIRTLLCVVLVAFPSTLLGQSYTGTIIGTLKDTSGAVIPAANVTITNQQTARTESTTTDIEGRYISVPLAPGVYRVEASLQGFRGAARPDVTVQVNSTVVIDFTLEVGQLTDQVEVRADATLLETDSGTVGKVVDNRRILELPLNTRNVYSLIFLTPGVAGTIGNNYNSMSYSVNGARPTMMDTVIDGVTASFPTVNGFTGISVFPSVDAIQEFKVLGANYPAEYGRSLGSVLNVVYKSGTNAVPWERVRVLPRLGLRRQQLLRQAGRNAARRFPAQPVRRRGRRADSPQPDVLHDLVRGTARAAPVAADDHRADVGAAAGGLFADVRAERPADSYLRSVHHAGKSGGPASSATRSPATSFPPAEWIPWRSRCSGISRCRISPAIR